MIALYSLKSMQITNILHNKIIHTKHLQSYHNRYSYYSFSVCYCSKNYMSDLTRQLDADCTTKCSGDNSSSCGGAPNFVSSYITDKSSKSTLFVLCFLILIHNRYQNQCIFCNLKRHVEFKI